MTQPDAQPDAQPDLVEFICDQALQELRLTVTDLDADRVERKAQVALGLVHQRLQRPDLAVDGAVLPDPVIDAAIAATVELYRRKDAPFGVTGAWGPDGGAIRVSRDPLAGVEYLLEPYIGGWGIA